MFPDYDLPAGNANMRNVLVMYVISARSAISYATAECEKFPRFSEVNFVLMSEIDCTVRGSHYENMETC
jgi:hypothetical protein